MWSLLVACLYQNGFSFSSSFCCLVLNVYAEEKMLHVMAMKGLCYNYLHMDELKWNGSIVNLLFLFTAFSAVWEKKLVYCSLIILGYFLSADLHECLFFLLALCCGNGAFSTLSFFWLPELSESCN